MIEFLIFAALFYIGLKVAWWVIKTTLFIGLAALVVAALFVPWVVIF